MKKLIRGLQRQLGAQEIDDGVYIKDRAIIKPPNRL